MSRAIRKTRRTVERKFAIKNSVGRIIIVATLLVLQVALLLFGFVFLFTKLPLMMYFMYALGFIFVIGLNAKDHANDIKLIWVIIIMAFPVVGIVLYLLFHYSPAMHVMKKKIRNADNFMMENLKQDEDTSEKFEKLAPHEFTMFKYLKDYALYPFYTDTDTRYYSNANDCYQAMIEDISKARSYVFMEYHAIENKEAFEPLHECLKAKAAAGVDVRVIYDDIGSFVFVNSDFKKMLESEGIKCCIFNPMSPMLDVFMNNRDHRKICVVDGEIGYTGGFNIANEYFNITHPFGQWYDTGIRMEGPAVKNLTVMFLTMWELYDDSTHDVDFSLFYQEIAPRHGNGFIAPYGDSPLDEELTGENVYINILYNSKNYCWFTTPYLVISENMRRAISLASKRGVDVRIITPGIPDKVTVNKLTKSYYSSLIAAGCKIYEYTPGFVHAKMCISDGKVAVVGTINMDFRSLYHHFEDAVLMFGTDCIPDIKVSFDELMLECEDVTVKFSTRPNIFMRVGRSILRLVAPML
ncbi:cardiolipin synthase [Ruminococcaceae bacterium YRB3002]|nr:cardiolipin synthase [Ruminococcaceae bacterium YRB3002]